jgi:hypothetical protein
VCARVGVCVTESSILRNVTHSEHHTDDLADEPHMEKVLVCVRVCACVTESSKLRNVTVPQYTRNITDDLAYESHMEKVLEETLDCNNTALVEPA